MDSHENIPFKDLPERAIETSDNPYRGLIGELQHEGYLERSSIEFSQFLAAEALVRDQVVAWDEISLEASEKEFNKAKKRAAEYFHEHPIEAIVRLHQKTLRSQALTCEGIF